MPTYSISKLEHEDNHDADDLEQWRPVARGLRLFELRYWLRELRMAGYDSEVNIQVEREFSSKAEVRKDMEEHERLARIRQRVSASKPKQSELFAS